MANRLEVRQYKIPKFDEVSYDKSIDQELCVYS